MKSDSPPAKVRSRVLVCSLVCSPEASRFTDCLLVQLGDTENQSIMPTAYISTEQTSYSTLPPVYCAHASDKDAGASTDELQ